MNPDINTFPIPDASQADSGIREHRTVPTPAPGVGIPPGPAAAHIAKMPTTTESEVEFEKKWVAKAKTIVMQTKYDPYLQSTELSKAGREYRNELRLRG